MNAQASIATIKSAMQGAWPGRIGAGGRLPYAWNLINPGVSVDVLDIGTDRGIDYVEVKVDGAPASTLPLEFQFNRWAAAQGDIVETINWMAGIDGTRYGVTKVVFGLNGFDPSGAYTWNVWHTKNLVFPRDRELRRYVESFGPLGDPTGSVISKIGIYLTTGLRTDFTLRLGWSRCIVTTP